YETDDYILQDNYQDYETDNYISKLNLKEEIIFTSFNYYRESSI
ncbi:5603_t:CDS:1, partial [Racocetra fulgida]